MPAWWWKSRAKAKPETEALEKKEKARSFDETAVSGRERITNESNISSSNSPRGGSASLFSFESDVERKVVVCHPLPRPTILSSVSLPHHDSGGSAGASASVSSVSSSGSSDETPNLANYRVSEGVVIPRGRTPVRDSQRQHQYVAEDRKPVSGSPIREFTERPVNFPVSPRRDLQTSNGSMYSNETIFSPGSRSPVNFPVSPRRDLQTSNGSMYSNETIFSPGSRSPGPRSRGCVLSSSPVSSKMFITGPQSPVGKHDDVRSPSHPLPLPPGSPTSPASRSLQSKWKKGKLLGRGTFGHVYAGFNSENGQMCAIKEVEVISDDANSKECLKQLAQEINLLSQLSHPNIVQYYGSELVDDRLSVYLEYVSGGSIHKLLQEYGPFGEPVIRSYAGQILSGLAYLHGRNTIHRDIKGANILVDPNGEIKLADFGMAKHISSYTSTRSFKGSPYWMAPEVIMNASGYTLSVDIWSLGCTIIEMASAKPPWSNYTGVQAIFKIGNSKDFPEIPEHLSREGKSFLKHCLQRDPALRPTAVKLMDHPFVRDQAKLKISHGSEAYPSSSDGCRSPAASDFVSNNRAASNYAYNRQPGNDSAYNRSISPLQSRAMINTLECSPVSKTPSDLTGLRVNMSLPVSPCSSPLRQFRQSNWSCLPSPSHPLGANNYGLSNNLSYPSGYSSRYTDHLPDLSLPSGLSMYGSPRT